MIERLIDAWLTEVDERGYQLPFCQVLIARGYQVLHISSHGPGEHGKDVIARAPDGVLETFQLKKGDVTLGTWREIRGEVQDLVDLPVEFPGVDPTEPHRPFLVLSGDLRGDARSSIGYYSREWERRGSPRLGVIPKGQLVSWFLEAHGAYLPVEIPDFEALAKLYTADPRGRIDVPALSQFLSSLVASDRIGKTRLRQQRAVNSMALTASYIVSRCHACGNHLAAAQGWTVTAATILQVAERERMASNWYEGALSLAWEGYWTSIEAFEIEAFEAETFVQHAGVLAEPLLLPVRTTLILGWVACATLTRHFLGLGGPDQTAIAKLLKKHMAQFKLSSESEWPSLLLVALMMGKVHGTRETEELVLAWLRGIVHANEGDDATGIPSPYWAPERVVRHRAGMLPPHEVEVFAGHSYTAHAALDVLVRRLRRQAVGVLWPAVSRVHFCDFNPGRPQDWFRWRSEAGEVKIVDHPQPVSWSLWRSEALNVQTARLPRSFTRHPEWIAAFLLTFPHRANRTASGFLDAIFAGFADLETSIETQEPE